MQQQMTIDSCVYKPLAVRMRPAKLEDFIGQGHIIAAGTLLRTEIERDVFPSIILWGPPGSGKTTLVNIIAANTKAFLFTLSAVTSGVKDIKQVIDKSDNNRLYGKKTILFIDEIHRLNKSQQDVLLPGVENGKFILIGATTENPSFEINTALLSRTRVIVLKPLTTENISDILMNAIKNDTELKNYKINITNEETKLIAEYAGGDARIALNILESVVCFLVQNNDNEISITEQLIKDVFTGDLMIYDKKGDQHFNCISALHKSMRNSDPDASVYWLARMLEGGENPLYIARRLIRFASEDIGLADYKALQIAINAYNAARYIGYPECNVNLAQAVVYLSIAPKSNSLYTAYESAKKDAFATKEIPVPLHLCNAVTPLMISLDYGKGYSYAHDYEETVTNMHCLPQCLTNKKYYYPKESGGERIAKERLEQIVKIKKSMGQSLKSPSDKNAK